jgi:hypothetical protein
MQGLLLLVLIGTGLIFFLQNRQPIQLNFFGTTAESALASFTLPLGLWVVIFLALGVFTSLVINILSAIGQPKPRPQKQNFRPDPPRRSSTESFDFDPTPPRSPSPPRTTSQPEPVMEEEWDWDEVVPDLTDWDGKKPEPRPKREVKDTPRNPTPRAQVSPEKVNLPETERLNQGQPNSGFANQDNLLDMVDESEQIKREPLPDLRQFEAPQTPKSTQREGTIYSQQYRPARPSQAKPKPPEAKTKQSPSNGVYDVPYRVINSAPSPVTNDDDNFGEEEDWI